MTSDAVVPGSSAAAACGRPIFASFGLVLAACGTCSAPTESAGAAESSEVQGSAAGSLAITEERGCTIRPSGDVVCWSGVEPAERVRLPGRALSIGTSMNGSFCALDDVGRVMCWELGARSRPPTERLAVPGATELASAGRQTCVRAGDRTTCVADDPLGAPLEVADGASRILAAAGFVCALRGRDGASCDSGSRRFALEGPVVDLAGDDDRICYATETETRCTRASSVDLGAEWQVVPDLGGAERLAVGDDQVCALRRGRVRCAGWSGRGALGPSAPVATRGAWDVPLSAPAVAIDAVGGVTCVRADGVFCFGDTTVGVHSAPAPVLEAVELGGRAVHVAAYEHSCASREDGAVFCWGRDRGGRLASGEDGVYPLPRRVDGIEGARALLAGYISTCALDDEGAWCWGASLESPIPPTLRARGATAIAMEDWDLFAVSSGALEVLSVATGETSRSDERPRPLPLAGAVEPGHLGFALCVRTEQGRVLCMGRAPNGELGGRAEARRWTPVAAPVAADAAGLARAGAPCTERCGALERVVDLDARASSACVVLDGGEVACWGSNGYAKVGPAEVHTVHRPLLRPDVHDATSACVGFSYACALRRTGEVTCWGEDERVPAGAAAVRGATALACGSEHACVIVDGVVRCWGRSDEGRLGVAAVVGATPRLVEGTR